MLENNWSSHAQLVLCFPLAQPCPTLCDPMDWSPPGTSVREDSSGRNTGVGCHALLRGAFNQGSNPSLPHCRQTPYHLSHQRSPRIHEWVAYPFSKRSSQPRDSTRVSCIPGGFLTCWATREAGICSHSDPNLPGLFTLHSQWNSPESIPFSIHRIRGGDGRLDDL